MTTIRDAIRLVTQDNKVTKEEWDNTLKPLADALPLEASEDARELVALFTNDQFELDAGAKTALRTTLRNRGYDVPQTRPAGVDNAAFAEAVINSNVTETDAVFESLQQRAGLADTRVIVGVLDTGLDVQHAALQDKLWVNEGEIPDDGIDNDGNGYVDDRNGFDFNTGKGLKGDSHAVNPEVPEGWVDDPDMPRSLLKDTDGHGTHVSGIITKGTKSVDVMGLTVIAGSNFSGKLAAEAFDYAAANGAKVLNMSFRVNNKQDVADMLEAMAKHPDILFVASAGNDGRDINSYVAESYLKKNTLPNFIVVSSADQDGPRASYSNYGKPWATHADVGSQVLSTTPGNKFTAMSGTSMASPNVGAAAAKARLLDPGLTATQVKDLLAMTTPAEAGWDPLVNSGGLIDAQSAYTVAALTGLVRREGVTLEAAAERLGLDAETFESLRAVAEHFAPAVEPELPVEEPAQAACD